MTALLVNMALSWIAIAPIVVTQADQDPEAGPRGRTEYFGRDIARTAHWSGEEQHPREIDIEERHRNTLIRQLDIAPDQTVCDLGCGEGLYTVPMAKTVASKGKVYAVDVRKPALSALREHLLAEEVSNVETVLARARDVAVPPRSCDLILMAEVYHEIAHPRTILDQLRAVLRPGGRLVIVEFRAEDPQVKLDPLHRMSKAQILGELAASGFQFESEFNELPSQHLICFTAESKEQRELPKASVVGLAVAEGFKRAYMSGDPQVVQWFGAEKITFQGPSAEVENLGAKEWADRYWDQVVAFGLDEWRDASRYRSWSSEIRSDSDGILLRAGRKVDGTEWKLLPDSSGSWRVVREVRRK